MAVMPRFLAPSDGRPGQGQEHLVQAGAAQGQLADDDAARRRGGGPPRAGRPGRRPRRGPVGPSTSAARAGTSATIARTLSTSAGSAGRTSRVWPPIFAFSSSGVPVAITRPWSTTAISCGQLVGLVQVLRGEQHGDAGREQPPHHVPHLDAAARVQPGGRLVEEQHLGPADQARGQVQPAPHAAGVGLGRPVGRVVEAERGQQLARPGPGLAPGHAQQPADEQQVLHPGQRLVHRRVLPGQPDQLADLVRLAHHVVARRRWRARRPA